MKIFLASPLGFAESTRAFIGQMVSKLQNRGYEAIDPWSSSRDLEAELQRLESIDDYTLREHEYHRISMKIAERNARMLRSCEGMLAVLDGVDVDSGTASEIGYAYGLGGKVINGYRGDFRQSGENNGVLVNLQVQYWIEHSGGIIITSLDEIDRLTFES